MSRITCRNCQRRIDERLGGKTLCQKCERELSGWQNGLVEPLPKAIRHTEKKPLKHIGSPCPYCRGTTGFHPFEKIVICYSCDYSWSFRGIPLGKINNVGVIR